MKTIFESIGDRILPKFSEVCKRNKCKHPKCECGHCSRNYHIGRNEECTKLNLDLTVCDCKKFKDVKATARAKKSSKLT